MMSVHCIRFAVLGFFVVIRLICSQGKSVSSRRLHTSCTLGHSPADCVDPTESDY